MASSSPATAHEWQSLDTAHLKEQTVPPVILLTLATGFYGCLYYLLGDWFRWREFLCFAAVLLLGASARALQRRSLGKAGAVLLGGLYGVAVAASALLPQPVATILLGLSVVLAAGMLVVPWAVPVAALFASLCLVAVHLLLQPQPQLGLALLAYNLSGAVLFLGLRSTYRVLLWSWQRHAEALTLTESLRDRQAELNRLVKALDLAYRLLQRTNHELRLAREEADEARRFKERFAANISHELRTPLNLILGFSEMMFDSPQIYGDVNWTIPLRRDVSRIYDASRHLSQLVDDVLDLSRLNAERMPLHRETCNLGDVIDEAVATARGLAWKNAVELRSELAPGLPSLLLDATRMRQVILNLINNALRFTAQGEVVVAAERRADDVLIAVRDTGIGIAAADLDRIFDEFYQVDSDGELPGSGMGLGLAISRRFVRMHGGRLWAESKPGTGSTFYVSLPLEDRPGRTATASSPAPAPTREAQEARTVLLLGEQPDTARLLGRHLEGYSLVCAADGPEARRQIAAHHPRAVIHNTALRELRRLAAELVPRGLVDTPPVVFCSIPSLAWYQETLGAFGSLQKPLRRQDLIDLLGKLEEAHDIMVIDDDRGFSQMVARMLESTGKGYRVRRTYNGRDGLAAMREDAPDAVLVDLMMPGMGGVALIEAMRQEDRLRAIPVIVVTALDVATAMDCPQMSIVGIAQPRGWDVGDTVRAMNELLALAGPRLATPETASAEPAADRHG